MSNLPMSALEKMVEEWADTALQFVSDEISIWTATATERVYVLDESAACIRQD